MTQDHSTKKSMTPQAQAELLLNLVNKMNVSMTQLLAIIAADYQNHPNGAKVLGFANTVANGLGGLANVYNTVLTQMQARDSTLGQPLSRPQATMVTDPVAASVNLSTGAAMSVKPYLGGERPPTMEQRQPQTLQELNDELTASNRAGIPYVDLSAPTPYEPHPVFTEKYGEECPYFKYLSPHIHRHGHGTLKQGPVLGAYREDILGVSFDKLGRFPNGFYGVTGSNNLSQLYVRENDRYGYVWVFRNDTVRQEGLHVLIFPEAQTKAISAMDGDQAESISENFEQLLRNLSITSR